MTIARQGMHVSDESNIPRSTHSIILLLNSVISSASSQLFCTTHTLCATTMCRCYPRHYWYFNIYKYYCLLSRILLSTDIWATRTHLNSSLHGSEFWYPGYVCFNLTFHLHHTSHISFNWNCEQHRIRCSMRHRNFIIYSRSSVLFFFLKRIKNRAKQT